MRVLDVADNPRVSALLDLVHSLGNSHDPREALEPLLATMRPTPHARIYAQITLSDDGYKINRLRSGDGEDLLAGMQPAAPAGAGFVGQMLRTPLPKLVHNIDLNGDPVLPMAMARYHSAIAMPLFAEGGVREWVILFDRRGEGLGVGDLEEMIVRSHLVAAMAGNLKVTQRLVEANLRINQEMEQIGGIQRSLLPRELPDIPGLSVAASYEALADAGGDLYDLLALSAEPHRAHKGIGIERQLSQQSRWAILIGDVAGHGASAAVVMAILQSILHAYPLRPEGPGEVLAHMNRHLCAKQIGSTFATAFLAIYDPQTRALQYACAGHPPPLLYCPNGGCRYLEAVGDMPLGVSPREKYAEAGVTLAPGQIVALFTDGITEARNDNGEFYETSRLEAAVASASGSATDALKSIRQSLLEHTQGAMLTDDQTIVVLQVR